ncbi:ester cyclase [Yinghuangia sp. YIM S09857]|uniref:ester cyclase n=1 Tax=Yinghuangia sp. YIM S09857 TaxID=3436929 RepID=UPI003F52B711
MTDLKALYRRWLFDVWAGDFDVVERIFTPDVVGHWPTHDFHGPGELADQVRQSHALFTGIENTLDVGPVVDGDLLAARWTFHGTYQGGIPDAQAPAGTEVAFHGVDMLRAEDGRFAEYWVVSDSLGLMTRLGALGTPSG